MHLVRLLDALIANQVVFIKSIKTAWLTRSENEDKIINICGERKIRKPKMITLVLENRGKNRIAKQRLEKLDRILNLTHDLICIAGMDGYFKYVNPAWERLLGYSAEELLSKPYLDFIHPDDHRRNDAEVDRLSQGDKTFDFENRYLCKDGSIRHISWTATPLPEEGLMYCIGRDITGRKKAEDALMRQQRAITLNNRIANVFLTSPPEKIYIDVLDVILETLESKFGYFGYIDDDENLVCPSMMHDAWGKCHVAGVSIDFPKETWEGPWGRSLVEKKTITINDGFRLPEGNIMLECGMAVPIPHRNKMIGQFVVANKPGGYDANDRELLESAAMQTGPVLFAILEEARQKEQHEKLEAQYQHAQKMETIGTLAGGIAHDFNNILSAIIGFTEIAWENAGDAPSARDSLKEVLRASQRAKDLVAQILTFSRQSEQFSAPVQVHLIVKEVCKMLRATLPSIIVIKHDIQSFSATIADAGQIHQIIMNLCTNAFQAMKDAGGVLTINLAELELDKTSVMDHEDLIPGKYLQLTVSDTGGGMDEGTINRIFDPYFTTKKSGEGTGLGLSVVFGIVKAHGGAIRVESTINAGTAFTVLLPAIEKATIDELDDEMETIELGNERILFIDDELPLTDMARQTLEPLGYHVQVRTSSIEALELFKAKPNDFDLVITDLMMPNMTGDHLAQEILNIRPEIPMIICTGFSDRIGNNEARSIGLKALVRKPWLKAEMARVIRKVLDDSDDED